MTRLNPVAIDSTRYANPIDDYGYFNQGRGIGDKTPTIPVFQALPSVPEFGSSKQTVRAWAESVASINKANALQVGQGYQSPDLLAGQLFEARTAEARARSPPVIISPSGGGGYSGGDGGAVAKGGMADTLAIQLGTMRSPYNPTSGIVPVVSSGIGGASDRVTTAISQGFNTVGSILNSLVEWGNNPQLVDKPYQPSEIITYPIYSIAHGAADWYRVNIGERFDSVVTLANKNPLYQQYKKVSDIFPGLSLGPLKLGGTGNELFVRGMIITAPPATAEMAGMIPPGVEILARNPRIIPAAAGAGLIMQARGTYEGIKTRPYEFLGEQVGIGLLTMGVGKGIKFVSPVEFGVAKIPTGRTLPKGTPEVNAYTMFIGKRPLTFAETGGRSLFGLARGPNVGTRFFLGSPARLMERTPIRIISGFTSGQPWNRATFAAMKPFIDTSATPAAAQLWTEATAAVRASRSILYKPKQLELYGGTPTIGVSQGTMADAFRIIETRGKSVVTGGSRGGAVFTSGRGMRSIIEADVDLWVKSSEIEPLYRELLARVRQERPDAIGSFSIGEDGPKFNIGVPENPSHAIFGAHTIEQMPYTARNTIQVKAVGGATLNVPHPTEFLSMKLSGMFEGWVKEPGKPLELKMNMGRVKDISDAYSISRVVSRDLYQPPRYDLGGIITRRKVGYARNLETFSENLIRYARETPAWEELSGKIGEIRYDPLKGVNRFPESRVDFLTGRGLFPERSPFGLGEEATLFPGRSRGAIKTLTEPEYPSVGLVGRNLDYRILGLTRPSAYPAGLSKPISGLVTSYPRTQTPEYYTGATGYTKPAQYPVLLQGYGGGTAYPEEAYSGRGLYPTGYPRTQIGDTPRYQIQPKYPKTPKYPGPEYPKTPTPLKPDYPRPPQVPKYLRTPPTSSLKYPGRLTVPKYPTPPTTGNYPRGVSGVTGVTGSTRVVTAGSTRPFLSLIPETSITVPWARPRQFLLKTEIPPKSPKLRLHFDVLGSQWNIRNPIPRFSGRYPKVELRISNKRYTRSPQDLTYHRPYDKYITNKDVLGKGWHLKNPIPRFSGKYPKNELDVRKTLS
jgi:hypothetical protein